MKTKSRFISALISPVLGMSAFAMASLMVPAHSQSLEPRVAGHKSTLAQLKAMPASARVVVKFKEGQTIRLRSGRFTGIAPGNAAAFDRVLARLHVPKGALRRLHARPEADLDAERQAGQKESGQALADLNLYYVIDLPKGVSAAEVAAALNGLAAVEFAEPGPVAPPPPIDIPPATPDLKANQGYRNAPPQGVGALNSFYYPGADGIKMRVADVEYSWQLDHEDLEIPASRILAGGATASDPFADTNHGTAVLGEIVGRRNTYGVSGLGSSAQVWLAPANTAQFGYDPARAIGLASGVLRYGDVMVIEQQYWVCGLGGSSFGPSEWLQPVFDAISAATARGIIVTEAAGNGGVDLDGANCLGKFDKAVRHSRAIIVGAGSSTTRNRLSFSSFGSRVDVQGWGENVTTTGYGGAFNPGDVRQLYTNFFSGTSSATPIVAGAALAIQGVMKACGVTPLNANKMRNTLIATGTPQGTGVAGHIGPLPRIKPALLATAAAACVLALP